MMRLILFLLATLATADETATWGAGTKSCGKVVSEKVESDGKMYLDWPTGQWVLGYLSATVVISPKLDPLLSTLDADAITAFVFRHCEENPLESLKDATISLIREKIKLSTIKSKPEAPTPFK